MKTALFLYNPQSGKGRIDRCVGEICTVFGAYGYEVRPQEVDFDTNPFDGNETIEARFKARSLKNLRPNLRLFPNIRLSRT